MRSKHLARWAVDHDAVIGIREPSTISTGPTASAFGDLALDVSPRRFPSTAAVLRATDVLVTDYDGTALDFTVTGRPVVSFAHDLDTAADRLLYDLEHMFPGPVCRDFADRSPSPSRRSSILPRRPLPDSTTASVVC